MCGNGEAQNLPILCGPCNRHKGVGVTVRWPFEHPGVMIRWLRIRTPCRLGQAEGGTGRRPHARPAASPAAGEAGGFNAVQKLFTNRVKAASRIKSRQDPGSW